MRGGLNHAPGRPARRTYCTHSAIARSPLSTLRLACAALLLAACAGPGSEVHVAPLYQRLSSADGGTRSEGAFGIWQMERPAPEQPPRWHGLLPLWSWRDNRQFHELTAIEGGEPREGKFTTTWLLPPFGRTLTRDDWRLSYFVPLFIWGSKENELFGVTDRSAFIFPGLLVQYEDGDLAFGWFPFLGVHDSLLSYEEVTYVLWPLYVTAKKDGRDSKHFFFPILGWTRGNGEDSFRLWPLFGRSRLEGRYDRRFFLWPFFQIHENFISGDREVKETTHTVFPFFGRKQRGSYKSWTFLWPLFGYSRNPETGYWALDLPWPFVRFQRGGTEEEPADRTRVWPFYGRLVADRMRSTSWAFPFVHHRIETYGGASREARHLLPFYQSWDRVDYATGQESSWRQVWPLYQRVNDLDGETRWAFPALYPLWRSRFIDRHYAWIWELYRVSDMGDQRSVRGWAGLWSQERDPHEDRRSLSGLWAQRRVNDPAGAWSETSLLFGLLRWRSTPQGRSLMAPAFPGPGWPLERVGAPLPPSPSDER